MKTTLKKILTLFLSISLILSTLMCTFSVSAVTADHNADFMAGKYGIMVHYLPAPETLQSSVDSFDAGSFAKQAHNAGVSWVLFTLTQSNGYYNIPMDNHSELFTDRDVNVAAGEKDIVEKLYEALNPYGIKLMLYWIPGAPSATSADSVAAAMGATERESSGTDWILNDATVDTMSEIMESVSTYYGDKVAGWWIDGCYDRVNFTAEYAAQEAAALKSGNADAVIAFNNGTSYDDCRFDVEDYAAGEICNNGTLDTVSIYDYSASSRWTEKGYQKHYLTFLGTNWGAGDERYEASALVNHAYNNILAKGAALTFDINCTKSGNLDSEQLNQLVVLNKTVGVVDKTFAIDFENSNPFAWVSNVVNEDNYSNDSAYIQLVNGKAALNGATSLKIIPKSGNTRTDVIAAVTSPVNIEKPDWIPFNGNPDFDKADAENGFANLSGVVFRMKILNDGDTAHNFKLALQQSGIANPTFLGSNAKLYKYDGSFLGTVQNTEAGIAGLIPAGFDGFVFLPFSSATSDRIHAPGYYTNYSNDPDYMVDLSKEFQARMILTGSSYEGTNILIDDINFYYGNTDSDAWDTMRAMGYDVIYHAQPSVYEFPLNFEKGEMPITSGKQFYTRRNKTTGTTLGWPDFSNLTTTELVVGEGALNGKVSLKVNMAPSAFKTDEAFDDFARMESAFFSVKGIKNFSTEKMKSLVNFSRDAANKYAYIKIAVKTPDADGDYMLRLGINQEGLTNRYVMCNIGTAYNADGTVNTDVVSYGDQCHIPGGFEGVLYFPIYSLRNISTYQGAFENGIAPDFSKDFKMNLELSGGVWEGNFAVIDDISAFVAGDLPFDFEDTKCDFDYYGMNSDYGVTPYSKDNLHISSEYALNGNGSLYVNMLSSETTAKYYSGPRITVPGVGENKPAGIMLRMKLINDTATQPHNMFGLMLTKDGSQNNETMVGGGATKLYHADGTLYQSYELSKDAKGSYCIPTGFDGFIFFPLDVLDFRTVGTEYIDISETYTMQFLFWNTDSSNRTWESVDAVIFDDISYYDVTDSEAGLTDAEAWNIMRDAGYDVFKAEQPDTYTLPFDFEAYEKPFNSVTANYVYNGAYPTKTEETEFVVRENALSGDTSLKLTVPETTNADYNLVWSGTNYASIKGIAGLDKNTLSLANKDFAFLKIRVKTPDTADQYQVRINLRQTGIQHTTVLASGAYAIDKAGYNYAITSNGLDCYLPGGFEGDIYFPIALASSERIYASGQYTNYSNDPDYMVDLTQEFQMQIMFWNANVAGQSFVIDNMSVVINVQGDINGNGVANAEDLAILRKCILGVDKSYEDKCDITGDGNVNVIDLVRLKKIILD